MVSIGPSVKEELSRQNVSTDGRTDRQPDSSIPPQLHCGVIKNNFVFENKHLSTIPEMYTSATISAKKNYYIHFKR
ncbi:hypothetical protein CI610_03423 [invertebrate metagenome]|uniref:Uncharacterized protein n=1 Tax=invertebrate metagenome TaxID=1711999 RepID=A0A2H9T384_9ZZZZ